MQDGRWSVARRRVRPALFAAEIYRMYAHYAEARRWKIEVMEMDEIGIGGIKNISFMIRKINYNIF